MDIELFFVVSVLLLASVSIALSAGTEVEMSVKVWVPVPVKVCRVAGRHGFRDLGFLDVQGSRQACFMGLDTQDHHGPTCMVLVPFAQYLHRIYVCHSWGTIEGDTQHHALCPLACGNLASVVHMHVTMMRFARKCADSVSNDH